MINILEDSDYYTEFKEFYLDSLENVKIIMSLLNHNCLRIKLKALSVLYCFFSEIDYRNEIILNVFLKNKEKFEKYFSKILADSEVDLDISEKANFILYQLERIQNKL